MLESVIVAKRSLVDGLDKRGMDALIGAMQRKTFNSKEVITAEGDMDDTFFIIESGEATVKKGEGAKGDIATLTRGDCFGEQALVPNDMWKRMRRKTSVVARESTVVLLMSSDAFIALCPSLNSSWSEQLAADIVATAVAGVDSVIAAKVGNVSSLNPQTGGKKLSAAAQKRAATLAAATAANGQTQ